MQKEVEELKDAIRVSYFKPCLSNTCIYTVQVTNQVFFIRCDGVILFVQHVLVYMQSLYRYLKLYPTA